jgi:hypothetical protein
MNQQTLPIKFAESVEFTIPEFDIRPSIRLDFSSISGGEQRLIEAKIVNGGTYAELEYVYNEGYREAKKNLTVVGYEITQAKKIIRRLKSQYILDDYPDFLKKSKLKDNATVRDSFLESKQDYVDAQDRVDMLIALESLLEGKIKVFENVCRYMRKEMDILIRSGMIRDKHTS